jgi:hypothetical protein
MRALLFSLVVVSLSISGCSQKSSSPPISGGSSSSPQLDSSPEKGGSPPTTASSGPDEPAVDDLSVGPPVEFENLTVFPVVSKTARDEDRFITLDEGLKAGTVEIVEVGGGAAGMNPPADADDPANSAPNVGRQSDDATNEPEGPESSQEDAPAETPSEPETGATQQTDESQSGAEAAAGEAAAGESSTASHSEADEPAKEASTNENQGDAGESNDNAESDNEAAGGELIQDSDFEGLKPAQPPEEPVEQFEGPRDPSLTPTFPNDPSDVPASPEENQPPVPDGDAALLQNMANDQQQAAGGDVNRLLVINRSDRPLYLMPGEIIVGGRQDRTIGRELVIAPTGKPTPIDVFCVEARRWGGRASDQTAMLLSQASQNVANAATVALSDGVSPETAAAQAANGKFVASVGNLSKAARLAVQQSGDQGEVWNKVALANAESGVNPQSGAFTHNYVEQKAVQRLEPYLEALQRPVADTKNVVGVVAAVNGKLETIDVFESTPLFKKLWPKLLKSYALDAANSGPEPEAEAEAEADESLGGFDDFGESDELESNPWQLDESGVYLGCTPEAAAKFLADAVKAQVEKSETNAGVALIRRRGEGLVSFSAVDPSASTDAAAPSEALHISAYAQ